MLEEKQSKKQKNRGPQKRGPEKKLKCNLEPNCGAYLGVVMLQPHACAQRFRF